MSRSFVVEIGNLQSVKAVSFDIAWIDNEHLTGALSASVPSSILSEDVINTLTNLEELYFSGIETVNLSLLDKLKSLSTIQFSSSSTGFARDLFPKLKEARIVLDRPIKTGLMKELKATASLERLVVIDVHAANFSAEKFLEQSQPFFGDRVDIKIVDIDDSWQLAPDEFKQHRLNVRKRCVEKYLE